MTSFRDVLLSQPQCLHGSLRGVERECLRMTPDGYLAETPHPRALGSALTNPYVTTDYSEAMLELVTPPLPSVDEVLAFLADVHQFVHRSIGDELLWPASMPCILRGEDAVPLARYGRSHAARFKELYRLGLKNRYGSLMQSIAGVHFNVSLPDELWRHWAAFHRDDRPAKVVRSAGYFHVIRNFLRLGFVIPYLFGASPALCKTYLAGNDSHGLQDWDEDTAYLPWATSLRMSDIGYRNATQRNLQISFENVEDYAADLLAATRTPEPSFETIDEQLSPAVLQIENEFYCPIRPKPSKSLDLRPALALARHGVAYLEVRSLDVSPFAPVGVHSDQLLFIEGLVLYCLVTESPPFSDDDRVESGSNMRRVIYEGRRPGLKLQRQGRSVEFHAWVDEIFSGMEALAPLVPGLGAALQRQHERLHHPDQTPSAIILDQMGRRGWTFFQWAMRQTVDFERWFQHRRPTNQRLRMLAEAAARSLVDQEAIERNDRGTFADYCQKFLTVES